MKRLIRFIRDHWLAAVGSALAVATSLYILTRQLIRLAPHLGPSERSMLIMTKHGIDVLTHPLYAPYGILQWLAQKLPLPDMILAARLPSVLLGLVSLLLTAYVLLRWYGRRSAVFGLVILACSPWFLHVARLGTPSVAYFTAILALVAVHVYIHDNEEDARSWFIWLVVNASFLFLPGIIWLVLLSAGLQWRTIWHAWTVRNLWQRLVSVLIPVVIAAALTAAFISHHAQPLDWLGVPGSLSTLKVWPEQLLHTLLAVIWSGPNTPESWLPGIPILDFALTAMFAAGVAFYARHWQAARTRLLGSLLLAGIILASFGIVPLSAFVPILYIVIVAGIAYVLHFWLRHFPKNPIARSVGMIVVAVTIGLSCYFGLTQYFVAWPHNRAVEQVYQAR